MKSTIMIFVMLLFYSTYTAAACYGFNSTATINVSSLTLQRDIPVGARLAVQDYTSNHGGVYSCTPGSWSTLYVGIKATTAFSGITDGDERIYKTNIPGLGVKIGGVNYAGTISGWIGTGDTIDGNVNQSLIQIYTGAYNVTTYAGAVVSFYKIGEIGSGTLNQEIARIVMRNGASLWTTPEVPVKITGMKVTALSCSLTTPTVAAPLGDINDTAFGGVGSTVGNNDFNLGLNCAAGTKVSVTMSGTQNADTANTSVLALSGAGSAGVAKGVGAQILYNNTPLNIGSTLALKTSAGGIETLPFKARYYQTLSNVLPGSANATATLDITYQ